MQGHCSIFVRGVSAIFAVIFGAALVCAQDRPGPAPDVEALIRDGKVSAVEAKLAGGKTPDELHWIAQAAAIAGEKATKPPERQEQFADAEKRYRKWIAAVDASGAADDVRRIVEAAAARMELAMLLTQRWGGQDIDELEVSSGQCGDIKRAQRLLELAAVELDKATAAIRPIADEPEKYEEQLLTSGLYNVSLRLRFEAPYYLARVKLYIGTFETKDGEKRATALRAAESLFQQMIGTAPEGAPLLLCRIGLGMVLREQKRFDDAERELKRAIPETGEKAAAAQARFELGRTQVIAGRYSEARSTFAPMIAKDPDHLDDDEKSAAFYFNVARLWDGLSYIQEADARRKQGGAAAASQADQLRAQGTAKLSALGQRGGPWPAIVQVYVLASVDADADPKSLDPQQLLFVAQRLAEQGRTADAAARLKEASERPLADLELRGRILFELGMTHYRANELRPAAEAFEKLAAQIRSHSAAPQAATNAFTLWGKVADQSKDKKDYEHLAAVLLNLLQSYPDHEKRADAMWYLPVALQAAGRYSDAVEQFGNVPRESPRWEEAQYRKAMCMRQESENAQASLPPDQFVTRAKQTAAALTEYANKSLERSSAASKEDAEKIPRWSAEARISAAELMTLAGVDQHQPALDLLSNFEQQYTRTSGEDLMGRALAARIRAYRGLRQFDQAAKAVQKYLETVPVEKAGPTLQLVAQGMQEELERLRRDGKLAEAKKLAAEAVPTFQELEKWCKADPKREKDARVVALGLAGMHYTAGQLEEASTIIDALLKAEPDNGNYRRLSALVLTERALGDSGGAASQSSAGGASKEVVEAARAAWAKLLADPQLRTKAPERYWEARWQLLRLTLKLGNAAEVEKAIRQERVWFPDLGGPPWKDRLDALYTEAAAKSPPPASAPTK